MAYTKIHAVKATVHKAIAYICNPEKTDENILISSYGCSPETAHFDFNFALSKTNAKDENKAYHLIQSFLPGEVSFNEAHQIGIELADKVLEGKYSYVVSTHIDKGHVHNHIIFCAANNIDHHKYNSCKQTYYRIRRLSDGLCKEHSLSVIMPGGERGQKYNVWASEKNKRPRLRADINAAIKSSNTYEEFLQLMRAKGYQIKGEILNDRSHKYIAFFPPDGERFIRGSEKSLGTEYTKERISERISEVVQEQKKPQIKDYAAGRFIDTSKDRFQESAGLKQWAEIENLKIAASTYSKIDSITQLEQEISQKLVVVKKSRSSLVELEKRMKGMAEILKYAEQYKELRPYNVHYRKSKNPDDYLQKHESKLILYDGAKQMLRKAGVDLKTLDLDKMRSEFAALERQKKELQQAYKSSESELKQMKQQLDKLKKYLGREQETRSKERLKNEQSL